MVGKIAVPVGEQLELKGEENTIGYQVYADYAAAQRALRSMSVATDLGIATATFQYTFTVDPEGQELVHECEAFTNPRFSKFKSSVRCAALHSDLPVIVTGLKTDVSAERDDGSVSHVNLDKDVATLVQVGLLQINKIKYRRTIDQPQVEKDTRSPPPRSSTDPGGYLGVGMRNLDQKSADALGLT